MMPWVLLSHGNVDKEWAEQIASGQDVHDEAVWREQEIWSF